MMLNLKLLFITSADNNLKNPNGLPQMIMPFKKYKKKFMNI